MTKEKPPEYADVYDVLHHIQKNLKAPKTQYNKFGDYYYRDAEDIIEAFKAIAPEGCTLNIEDDVLFVPAEYESHSPSKEGVAVVKAAGRVYIKSAAILRFKGQEVKSASQAREEMTRKGMDASQVTSAATSYARKLALGGLFLIDDTKDSDKTDKTTKKEKEDQQLMEQTGTDNIQDAQAAKALGGSVTKMVDADTVERMYNQALVDLESAVDMKALEERWTKIAKGKKTFSKEQLDDLTAKKDEKKKELDMKAPF